MIGASKNTQVVLREGTGHAHGRKKKAGIHCRLQGSGLGGWINKTNPVKKGKNQTHTMYALKKEKAAKLKGNGFFGKLKRWGEIETKKTN